jgi:hypothetical protein
LRCASGGESVITTSGARNTRGAADGIRASHPRPHRRERDGVDARLIEAVGRRAKASPCEFALLIQDVTTRKAADWTLATAQRSLRPAARANVQGLVGGPDPFESVKAAVRDGNFDEIIISTLSKKTSKWLRRDLIRRVETLGLPVTAFRPPNFKEDLRTLDSTWAGRGGPTA